MKIVTGKVRLSYANIWHPKAINGGAEKYSVSILIPKTDTKTKAKIDEAIQAAYQAGLEKGTFKKGTTLEALHSPIHDGDIEKADDPNYRGCWFVNLNSNDAPQIVGRHKEPIEDEDEVYSGCYARVSLNTSPYNSNGNKGVGTYLGNIQKLADGERLDGRTSADDDFDDLEDDDDLGL